MLGSAKTEEFQAEGPYLMLKGILAGSGRSAQSLAGRLAQSMRDRLPRDGV